MTAILELATAVGQLSNVVKVSWVMVVMWAAMQVWLFRRLRIEVPVPVPAPAAAKAPRRPRAPRRRPDVASVIDDAGAVTAMESPHAIALPADSMYR